MAAVAGRKQNREGAAVADAPAMPWRREMR